MCKFSKMIFPTLVLIAFQIFLAIPATSAQALPTDPSPDFTQPTNENYNSHADLLKTETIDITEPRLIDSSRTLHQREAALGYFYKFHNELGAQIGMLYDTEVRGGEKHLHKTVSLRYLYPDHKLQSWEWNGTFISDSTGTLSFSRRFIGSQDRFRPYNSIGLGLHLLPAEPLGSFIRWRQYQMRGAAGCEYTSQMFSTELHWRAEAALALSFRSQQADLSVGLMWPW